MEKGERHPIAGRYSNKFPACVRSAKGLRRAHDLIQLLEQFNLLVYEEFGITDNIDSQEVRNLELEIGRRFRRRVLRVHPFENLTVPIRLIEGK